MDFTVTPAAAQKVLDVMSYEKDPPKALRIYVHGGGCSGFQYGFSFENEIAEDDYVLEFAGVKFVIDPASGTLLQGGRLDFDEDPFNSHFKIVNPNVVATCGCGSSFSVE